MDAFAACSGAISTFNGRCRYIPQGILAIMKGNRAAEGAIAKITDPARVFECEEDCLKAILDGKIKAENACWC